MGWSLMRRVNRSFLLRMSSLRHLKMRYRSTFKDLVHSMVYIRDKVTRSHSLGRTIDLNPTKKGFAHISFLTSNYSSRGCVASIVMSTLQGFCNISFKVIYCLTGDQLYAHIFMTVQRHIYKSNES